MQQIKQQLLRSIPQGAIDFGPWGPENTPGPIFLWAPEKDEFYLVITHEGLRALGLEPAALSAAGFEEGSEGWYVPLTPEELGATRPELLKEIEEIFDLVYSQ